MFTVIKSTGEKELFSEEKILTSIKRANIPQELQNQVVNHIKQNLYNNIPTSEIYRHITEFFGNSQQPYAKAKYSLKQSIMDFGPTGYPFEDFIAKVLETQGYKTQVRVILSGACIKHEVDVIAEKSSPTGKEKIMVEAKFHNMPGVKTDVHVALYTKARFDDVKEKYGLTKAWIVTNTNASLDAIAYAQCVGMQVISWDYPGDKSLRNMIELSKLSPLTALSSLSQSQKQTLLQNSTVLCKDVYTSPNTLDILGLSSEQKNKIFQEAMYVCKL